MNPDLERAHRERLQYLQERYDRAPEGEPQDKIQELIDAENLRWKIITDTQPKSK